MSILNQYIDNIYALYINDSELQNIKYKLNKKNIKAQYFLGVNGKLSLKKQFEDQTSKVNNKIKSIGALGHVHSFIKILEDAIFNKYNSILIFESDIYFSDNFDNKIKNHIYKDWNILYLGASQHSWTDIDINLAKVNGYYNAKNTCGTFSICLKNNIFLPFLKELKKKVFPSDICLLNHFQNYKSIVIYPNIISCNLSNSNISNPRDQNYYILKFKWFNKYFYDDLHLFRICEDCLFMIEFEVYSGQVDCESNYVRIIQNNKYVLPKVRILSNIYKKKNISPEIKINDQNRIIFVKSVDKFITIVINRILIKNIIFKKKKSADIIKKKINLFDPFIKNYYIKDVIT